MLIPTGFSKGSKALDLAPLREALNFLVVAGLIVQEGSHLLNARFHACPSNGLFTLDLLRQLQSHSEERQRALVLVHRQLVEDDTVAITLPQLRARVEQGPYRTLFAWTGEKLLFWSQLASHLGLIRSLARSGELLVIPTMELVESALRQVAGLDEGPCLLDDLLRQVDSAFFACYTNRGHIHAGLSHTLAAMHQLARFRLAHHADAARSHRLGTRRVSHLHWKGAS